MKYVKLLQQWQLCIQYNKTVLRAITLSFGINVIKVCITNLQLNLDNIAYKSRLVLYNFYEIFIHNLVPG